MEEFYKAYVEERAKALVYSTLVSELENADNMVIEVKKQLELPDRDYGI